MLLNSPSSNVFFVACAKAMEAADKRRRDKTIRTRMKFNFLIGYKGLNSRKLHTFKHKVSLDSTELQEFRRKVQTAVKLLTWFSEDEPIDNHEGDQAKAEHKQDLGSN